MNATLPPTPAPEAPKATKAPTSYGVFEATDNGATLSAVATVEALNDVKAITVALEGLNVESGTYVAIPSRSLRVRTVGVQTVSKTSIV